VVPSRLAAHQAFQFVLGQAEAAAFWHIFRKKTGCAYAHPVLKMF